MFDGQFRVHAERSLRPVGAGLRRTGITADHLTGARRRHGRGRGGRHRQRRPPGRAAAADPHRGPRRARRCRRQGVGHGVGPGRLLRLGRRPPHRRPPARRRRLVPRHHPARPHRRAAAGRAGRVDARSPTSGPRPSRSASTPRAASWSGPSASSPSASACCSTRCSSPCSGSCWSLTAGHRRPALRQGVAPGQLGPAAAGPQRPVRAVARARTVAGVAATRPAGVAAPAPAPPHALSAKAGRTGAARRWPVDPDVRRLPRSAPSPPRRCPARPSTRWPAARDGPGRRLMDGRRQVVERNLRRVHGGSLDGADLQRAVVRDLRLLRPLLDRVVPAAGHRRRRPRARGCPPRGSSTSTRRSPPGDGRDPRPAPPRRVGVGRVLAGRGQAACR